MSAAAVFTLAAPLALASGHTVEALRLREPTVREFLTLGPLALRPARKGYGTCAVDVPGRVLDYLSRLVLDLAPADVDEVINALPLADALRLKALVGSLVFGVPRGQVEEVADTLALDWRQATIPDLDRLALSELSHLARRVGEHAARVKQRNR